MRTFNMSYGMSCKTAFLKAIVIACACFSCSAQSAVIHVQERADSSHIHIIGEIKPGDANAFHEKLQIATLPTSVHIKSTGGDVVEAMKIGVMIRDRFLSVNAPMSFSCIPIVDNSMLWPADEPKSTACACYSACFIIYSAGIKRFGGANSSYNMSKQIAERGGNPHPALLHGESFIGIHRPRFGREYFSGLSADAAAEKYDELLLELTDYLVEMYVPESIVERMLATPSGELHFLTSAELDTMDGFIPAIDEWLRSKCDFLTNLEYDELSDLHTRKSDHALPLSPHQPLSRAEEFYLSSLDNKNSEQWSCIRQAIKEEQESRWEG